jgi:hypothetical protein
MRASLCLREDKWLVYPRIKVTKWYSQCQIEAGLGSDLEPFKYPVLLLSVLSQFYFNKETNQWKQREKGNEKKIKRKESNYR